MNTEVLLFLFRIERSLIFFSSGENFVVDKTGFLCRACNRFMLTQEDIKIHCQTIVHFNNIIKILKAQVS